MKNATVQELTALRARAAHIARRGEPLSAAIARVARENRIVGLSLVLCHPDGKNQTLHLGHARLAPRVPVTASTCFRIASVSKLVMSFGALALAERGLLSLDQEIGDVLGYPCAIPTRRIGRSPCACC